MVLTIVPAVREASLNLLLRCHALGLMLGALTTCALALAVHGLLALGGQVVLSVGWACLGVLAILWFPMRLGRQTLVKWPKSRWQVPEHWRYTLPAPFTSLVFGYLLGIGFLTNPMTPLYWMLVFLTALHGQALVAVIAWLTYAGVRWTMTARATRRVVRTATIPEHVHGQSALRRALTFSPLLMAAVLAVSAASLTTT